MSDSVKFIQISDLHLGARVLPRCFTVTSEKRIQREEEIISSLESLTQIFEEEGADVLLVPGDLFDRDSIDSATVNRVFDIFASLPFTCILPGNHDFLSAGSPYSEYERGRRGLNPIPDNVYIFSGREYSSIYLPGRADVSITGRPFTGNSVVTEHRMAEKIPRDPAEISILLHHGARTQFNFEERMKVTAPFTASELLAQNFSYTALGHYHSYSAVENGDGMIKAAYGGRPFACEFRAKDGCILIGEVKHHGVERLIQYDIDLRRIFDLSVNCDNVPDNKSILELATGEYEKNGVLKDDIVRFRFSGTRKGEFKPELLLDNDDFFTYVADFSELHYGYDIEEVVRTAGSSSATVESLFIRDLYSQLCNAESAEQRQVLMDAMDYGMKALRGLGISPKDIIDIEE